MDNNDETKKESSQFWRKGQLLACQSRGREAEMRHQSRMVLLFCDSVGRQLF